MVRVYGWVMVRVKYGGQMLPMVIFEEQVSEGGEVSLINRHQSTPAASKSDSARSSRRWNAVETAQTCRRRHRRHANSRLRRASVDYNELSSSDLVKTGARTRSRRLRLSVTLAELSRLTEPQKSMAECMRLGVHERTHGRTDVSKMQCLDGRYDGHWQQFRDPPHSVSL